MNFLKYRKQIIEVITIVSALLAQGALPSQYATYVAGALAAIGSVVHFQVPDATAPTPPAAPAA